MTFFGGDIAFRAAQLTTQYRFAKGTTSVFLDGDRLELETNRTVFSIDECRYLELQSGGFYDIFSWRSCLLCSSFDGLSTGEAGVYWCAFDGNGLEPQSNRKAFSIVEWR